MRISRHLFHRFAEILSFADASFSTAKVLPAKVLPAMPPIRQTIPILGQELMIQITDDQSRTLVFRDSPVAYHSASGAAAETQHVYLDNSGVSRRLRGGNRTAVLEIGLGTGLAMLMTLDVAMEMGTPLRYCSLERNVLGRDVLTQLQLGRHLRQAGLLESFLDFRDSLGAKVASGNYRWQPRDDQEVWLVCGDAVDTMDTIDTMDRGLLPGADRFDAIYFDPFAPSENPELWRPSFLRKMHAVLGVDGRLVTYCVSRQVRESFAAAGFEVRRVPGPRGGKREVMIAMRKQDQMV